MLAMHHLRLLFIGLSALLGGILVWTLVSEHQQTLQRDRLGAVDGTPGRPVPVTPRPAPAPQRPLSADTAPVTTTPAPASPTQTALLAGRTRVSDRMAEAPEYRDFRNRFAATFPGDWTRALEVMSQRPEASQVDTPDSIFVEALKNLRRSRGALAGKAGPDLLSAVFEQQMRLLAALSRTDKRLCVDYLFGEESQGFLDFARTHRTLAAGMGSATLDAIIDGSTKRIDRPAPSDADFAELEKILTQRGLGAAEIEALLDGRHPDPPIADDRLCDAGLVYLDVLKQMPEETRLRIYALAVELMSRL
jgi:hypothetical protein